MHCPKCDAYCGRRDNYCRYCGLALRLEQDTGLTVKGNGALPVVGRRAAPTLAQGLVVLALGAVAEMALRSLARRAVRSLPALPLPRPKSKRSLPAPDGGFAVSETVVMRRLTLRR